VLFMALALIDAVLLACLVLTHDWTNFHVKTDYVTPLGSLIVWIAWALLVFEKLFFVAFFGAIGFGIYRELAGAPVPTRGRAVMASLVLLAALAVMGWLFFAVVAHATAGPASFFLDRLTLFDSLAERANRFGGPLGMTHYVGGSIGAFLVFLVIATYLAEKYLAGWWGLRWPVAVVPLVAIGWLGWAVVSGEQRQRDWVAAQQWALLDGESSWLDAVAACEARGTGWRLPRRQEMALYLATQPAPAGWTGAAWTSSIAEDFDYALAVDLAPRKSGFWDRRSQLTRDESLCERRDGPGYGYANDWFTALRPQVCARTVQAPNLYTPGLKPAVLQTGNVQVSQPTAPALCIQPSGPTPSVRRWRGYRHEQEFTQAGDFVAAVEQRCATAPQRARAVCFTFVAPDFDETPDERFMRAFCELDSRQPEGCHRYALLMEHRGDQARRAAHFRSLACGKGYAPACGEAELKVAPASRR